jgi:hypothetical protein
MTKPNEFYTSLIHLIDVSIKRCDELRIEGLRRIEEHLITHATLTAQLAEAESNRIDAIRMVDVAAVSVASERAAQQAIVLANQVNQSAETLRTLVASTATAVAEQSQQLVNQLSDRITALEKSQYESKGRSGLSAPLLMMIAGLSGGIVVFIVQLLLVKK